MAPEGIEPGGRGEEESIQSIDVPYEISQQSATAEVALHAGVEGAASDVSTVKKPRNLKNLVDEGKNEAL